jgi:uncharacterized membrane protein
MSRKPSIPSNARFEAVDALRGLAMVWMTAFHFCFDLNQFGYIRQDFYRDPFWTMQRTLIVSLFLLCAGMGQAMAVTQQQSWQRFWQRWARVVGAALLVTAGSWWMYPQSFIYFGVLHGIALMLIVLRLTVRWRGWLWLMGAGAIAFWLAAVSLLQAGAAPMLVDALNSRALNWLGLITHKPITEDYVPLLPWLGAMWWGGAIGGWLAGPGAASLKRTLPALLKPLAWMGRWSLSYYLLHQPVMIGALMALGWVMGR